MPKQTLGEFISVLRKANGMTQKELAGRLNVSDKAVSRWENGDSYPDLMLIPVIADIFGVTADELLSGERKKEENILSENSEKNIGLLLKHTLSAYKSKIIISLGIAFFGLALAGVINFSTLKSVLAFCLAVLMFTVSAVCHTFFSNQAFSAVNSFDESFNPVAKSKRKLKNRMILIYSVIFSFFLFCLPLAIRGGINYGLDFMSWVYPGAAVTAIFCIILIIANSAFILKSKKYSFSESIRHNAKLKIKIISVWCFSVIFTLISMLVINNQMALVKGTEINNPDELYEFMKNYKSDEIITETVDGSELENQVFDFDGNILFTYPMNDHIVVINFNKHNDGKTVESFFPCTVYTQDDWSKRGSIVDGINAGFIAIYILEAVLPFIVYYRKRRKH